MVLSFLKYIFFLSFFILFTAGTQINLSNPDWMRATEVVNEVLDLLMLEIQSEAKKYTGLALEKYVKQG